MPEKDGKPNAPAGPGKVVSVIEGGDRVWMIQREDGTLEVISYERAFFIALERQAKMNLMLERQSVRPGAAQGAPQARPGATPSGQQSRPSAGPSIPPVRPSAAQVVPEQFAGGRKRSNPGWDYDPEQDHYQQVQAESANRRAAPAAPTTSAVAAAPGAMARIVDRSFDAAAKIASRTEKVALGTGKVALVASGKIASGGGSLAKISATAARRTAPPLLRKSNQLVTSGFSAAMQALRKPRAAPAAIESLPQQDEAAIQQGGTQEAATESHYERFERSTSEIATAMESLREGMDAVCEPSAHPGSHNDEDDDELELLGFSRPVYLGPKPKTQQTFHEIVSSHPHLHEQVEQINVMLSRAEESIDAVGIEVAEQAVDDDETTVLKRKEDMRASIEKLQEKCAQLFQKDHPFEERLDMHRGRIGLIFDAIAALFKQKKNQDTAEDDAQVPR